jgi:DNA polymerase-3 subunit gamma/tau
MRDSQSLLEQLLSFGHERITTVDVHTLLGTASDVRLAALANHLAARDAAAALGQLDGALAEGVEVGQLLEQLLGYFRDAMATEVGCTADALLYAAPAQHDEVAAIGKQLGLETILAIIQILDQTLSRLRYSTQGRTLAEIALVRIASLENLADIASLVGQLQSGAGETAPAVPSSPAPVPQTPAAKKKIELEIAASSTAQLSDETVEGIWQQALTQLTGLVGDMAGQADSVAISAPNRLAVTFLAKYNSCKVFCESPKNRAEIEAAISALVGQPVVVEFTLIAGPVTPVEQPVISTRQAMIEKNEHPLIRRAVELFDAQLVRVEPGRQAELGRQ